MFSSITAHFAPYPYSPSRSSHTLTRTGETYEALRESARRVFYLLTMDQCDGTLRVQEAERRGECVHAV